ncbi:hypothetical protein [Azospirillum sp. TSO5]|uniref:hypothetical protein n=1 Tax=Azospirillum sp. TSO5 TaxID=716760 RepID=UPI000D659375|nr:hypothetical protein [Azospirillum sp. TSO5]
MAERNAEVFGTPMYVVECRRRGQSVASIAKAMGVSREAVYFHLRRAGITGRTEGLARPGGLDEALAKAKAGADSGELAAEFGVRETWLRNVLLRRFGFRFDRSGSLRSRIRGEVLSLVRMGMFQRDIAAELGVSPALVSKIVVEAERGGAR